MLRLRDDDVASVLLNGDTWYEVVLGSFTCSDEEAFWRVPVKEPFGRAASSRAMSARVESIIAVQGA